MKIAILTHCSTKDNYGQLLQGFALQYFLKSRGHDAYLLQYLPKYNIPVQQNPKNKWFNWCKNLLNLKKYIQARTNAKYEQRIMQYNRQNNLMRNFDDFRHRNIRMSAMSYTSIQELRNNPPEADVYICGSDQVWHDSLENPNVAGWYLQFGDKGTKRISYAASIGREIYLNEVDIFKKYLSTFDALSLREKKALTFCRNIGFSHAKLVCDPTLLLPLNLYRKIAHTRKHSQNPFVFFYILNIRTKEELLWDSIEPIILTKKWEIKSVASSGYYPARNIIPENKNILATVEEWLQLIDNSSLVVSTSFHAIVFSIIFHKPFVSIPLRGNYSTANDRIYTLLENLGLEYRICNKKEDMENIINTPIDWILVDKKIKNMQQESIAFLRDAGL